MSIVERGISGQSALSEREEIEKAETMAVALAQPHRRGDADPKLESALGRLCRAKGWHEASFWAGSRYGDDIRRLRLAEGFYVPCGGSTVYGEPLTDAEREQYRLKVREADEELLSVKISLPQIFVDLCYWGKDQDARRHGIIGAGLVKLSFKYGFRKFFHQPA